MPWPPSHLGEIDERLSLGIQGLGLGIGIGLGQLSLMHILTKKHCRVTVNC